jgi:hypothetical protein
MLPLEVVGDNFIMKSQIATSRNKKAARKRLPCCLGNYSGGKIHFVKDILAKGSLRESSKGKAI